MPPFEETRLCEQLTVITKQLSRARYNDDSPLFKAVYAYPADTFQETDCPLAMINADSGTAFQVRVVVWTRDASKDEQQLLALHDWLSRSFDLSHSTFGQLFLQGWRYRSFSFFV